MAARWSVFYGNLRNINTRNLARHDNCEGGIVDAILIFINEDPSVRRSHNAAQLSVCFVSGSRKKTALPWRVWNKRLGHGITADLENTIADYMVWKTFDGMVGGTMINTRVIYVGYNSPCTKFAVLVLL